MYRVRYARRMDDSQLLGLRACAQCPRECKQCVERPEDYMIVPLDLENRAGAQYWMVGCAVIGFALPLARSYFAEMSLAQVGRRGMGVHMGLSMHSGYDATRGEP
jgi:hypothetical protein